jgi:hypothetical protein
LDAIKGAFHRAPLPKSAITSHCGLRAQLRRNFGTGNFSQCESLRKGGHAWEGGVAADRSCGACECECQQVNIPNRLRRTVFAVLQTGFSPEMGKTARVVVCGARGVGKTAILEQLIHGHVTPETVRGRNRMRKNEVDSAITRSSLCLFLSPIFMKC